MERCLASEPSERPANVRELREALQSYLNGADRQRESRQTVAEVQTVVETFGRENLDYEQLALLQQRLGRALQLWPGNDDAKILLRRLMGIHAELALEAGDLELARTTAVSLQDAQEKEGLIVRIEAAERARALETVDAKAVAFKLKVLYIMLALFALVAIAEGALLAAMAKR
jgi:hypothetical protein